MTLTWSRPSPDRDPGRFAGGMRYLVNGEVRDWKGASMEVHSPVYQPDGRGGLAKRVLGPCALLDAGVAKQAMEGAVKAYDSGRGKWPTASVTERIRHVETFLDRMEARRLEVARLLCWEVAKPWADALREFDRTVAYGRDTVSALKELDRASSRFTLDSGFFAQIRRSPFGVALCMGPYNYPLNEMYTTLLPALVMGNTVVAKLPRLGMLCNLPLLDAFAESFPPDVVSILTGEGSTVVTPLVESGAVDILAFIGSSKVANLIIQKHPRPNRLRTILGLGTKNPGIVLADADLKSTVDECVRGTMTFNGQRCTALGLIFVQRRIADAFAEHFSAAVASLRSGMPYEDGVTLTPLPEEGQVQRMSRLVEDAVAKGARVLNPGGGASDRTWFHPAVVYPVDRRMDLWTHETFGPVVPIAVFDDPREPLEWLAASPYGQQAALFGRDPAVVGPLVDALVNQVSRVNLNSQCQRGPDTFPFTGRKDSAEGTLSVTDALRVFSIRTLVASKADPSNTEVVQAVLRERTSRFLTTDYLF